MKSEIVGAHRTSAGLPADLSATDLSPNLAADREARFQAEAKYRALVEQIPAVVYLDPVDETRDSIFVSEQVRDLLGIEPDEWLSDPYSWSKRVHPDDSARAWEEYVDSYTRDVPLQHEYRMIHADGSVRWVLEFVHPIHDEDGAPWLIQGMIFDITKRKETEAAQSERSERLSRIVETQRDIAGADLDFEAVMHLICTRTRGITDAEGAVVFFLDGEDLLIRVATGFMSDQIGRRVPIEGSFPGWVFSNDRSAFAIDGPNDPRFGSIARELGIRSMVAVPLRHGEVAAELAVFSRELNAFTEEDLKTLELLSVVLSSALSHAAEFEALARFKTMYEGAAIGITLVSPQGRNIAANPAFEEMFGYSEEELATMTFRDFMHPDDIESNEALLGEMMAGKHDTYRLEVRVFHKDGRLVWGRVTTALHRDPDGRPMNVIAMVENVTERKGAEEQIAYLAYHDELTGLANRQGFQEEVESSLARARRNDLAVGVVFLDLDNFKLVNDSLGHEAGDELLVQLSARLSILSRETDLLARQSGDEFLLLLSDLGNGPGPLPGTDAALLATEAVASRIHELFRDPFTLEGAEFYVTTSIGISVFPRDAADAASLLSNADVAMYQSKSAGPGGTVAFSPAEEDAMLRLRLTTKLRLAVERESWELHYQPVVDLGDGHITGVEALIRGRDENGDLIPPMEFIPLAEEIGLIEPIGDWVMEEMFRQQKEWIDAGITMDMGFNVSPRQFWSERFAEKVLSKLDEVDVDPHRVVVEITESTAMTDPERTRAILQTLHDAGFMIAIDDFGTGFSSLA